MWPSMRSTRSGCISSSASRNAIQVVLHERPAALRLDACVRTPCLAFVHTRVALACHVESSVCRAAHIFLNSSGLRPTRLSTTTTRSTRRVCFATLSRERRSSGPQWARVHGIAAQTVASTRETGGRSGCAVPWFSAFPTLAARPRLLDWCTLCGLCLRCPWAGGRSGIFAATAHRQPKAASFRIVSPFSFSSHPTDIP